MAIRDQYIKHGVRPFYERCGASYLNPHEPVIRRALGEAVARWPVDFSEVLDLACGSGEVTLALLELGARTICGMDPYTLDAYRRRTGLGGEPISFEDIATGALAGRHFSLIVCSFAMHLIPPSRLPTLAYQLRTVADSLLILTPHKRPVLKSSWGWTLVEELVIERVRTRLYKGSKTG